MHTSPEHDHAVVVLP